MSPASSFLAFPTCFFPWPGVIFIFPRPEGRSFWHFDPILRSGLAPRSSQQPANPPASRPHVIIILLSPTFLASLTRTRGSSPRGLYDPATKMNTLKNSQIRSGTLTFVGLVFAAFLMCNQLHHRGTMSPPMGHRRSLSALDAYLENSAL